MRNRLLVGGLCFVIASCNGVGKSGDGVTYKGSSSIPCPPPVTIPQNVTDEFSRYENDPLMMQFYKHYLIQQHQLEAYRQKNPSTPNCPVAFWVENSVAEQFRQYPVNHPMREFFKTYAEQQREIDAHYGPNSH